MASNGSWPPMRLPLLRVERARPLLGTMVCIRAWSDCESSAHRAIDEACAEIALIHRLMSFLEPHSDVSRLNREAFLNPQEVYPATFEVLLWAQQLAEASEGCFDVSIGA